MSPFPEPSDQESLNGMTVNERLFAVGLLDQFDDAVRAGDKALMTVLLSRVGLETQADHIAEITLAHPTRYGRTRPTPDIKA